MSIPKEPRQLMINIMYLVLTALLALNVSAEIFNAFKLLDQGIIKSSSALDYSNASMPDAIRTAAKAKPSFQTYADRVEPLREESRLLTDYIEGLKNSIINESGGFVLDENSNQFTDKLIGESNIDVTTRILVQSSPELGSNKSKGEELKDKLLSFSSKIMEFIDEDDQDRFQKEIAINIDDQTWRKKEKASWSHMNFDRMPVQAVVPMINKYINDVKSTEAAVLNYLAAKVGMGKEEVVISDFMVIAAPEKSYVIKGDPYNANIFLTAAAGPDSGAKVKLSVNGRPLNLDTDGVAQYSVNTSTIGPKTYTASAEIYNPITEKTSTYTKEFSYEVGERSVAISPTNMNVFYIGVDNPVEISAAGSNSNTLQVSMSGQGGGRIKQNADGSYVVTVSTPTKRNEFANVNVVAEGMNSTKSFRVKRIPDPIPKLSDKRGGAMRSAEFKRQSGVYPVLENFDFKAECSIKEFRLVRVPRNDDPRVSINRGGIFSEESKALIAKAKATDTYFFEDIKCKCPGDSKLRNLGLMTFKII